MAATGAATAAMVVTAVTVAATGETDPIRLSG